MNAKPQNKSRKKYHQHWNDAAETKKQSTNKGRIVKKESAHTICQQEKYKHKTTALPPDNGLPLPHIQVVEEQFSQEVDY